MSLSSEVIRVTPEKFQTCAAEIENLAPSRLKCREAIEKVITLARQMLPEDDKGNWGQWRYHSGLGYGALYVPFGKDGQGAVYLSCAGNISQDDISKAGFVSAYAFWTLTRRRAGYTRNFKNLAIAKSGGEWFYNRGHELEPTLRKYFFYQETSDGLLRLEQFGSDKRGWYELGGFGIGFEENVVVHYGESERMRAFLDWNSVVEDFYTSMRAGRVRSMDIGDYRK